MENKLTQKRQITRKVVPRIVKQRPPSIRLYRRIAISFLILTVFLLALVAYLSFSKATIKIFPKIQETATQFNVNIVEAPTSSGQVEGRVFERIFEKTQQFEASGGEKTVQAKAGGEVRIINNYSKDQPLVATTRLLSEQGVLFRVDESVVAPAGSEVTVMVHADEAGSAGDIGPTRFTVPGLWAGLQDQIYAVSDAAMSGGEKTVSVISDDDLDTAESQLSQAILEQAKQVIMNEVVDPRLDGYTFSSEMMEKVSDAMPGQEVDSFNVKIKLKVSAVFFSSVQMDEIIRAKLEEALDQDCSLGQIAESEIIYVINNYDVANIAASLTVKAKADGVIKETSSLLDKGKIAGMSPAAASAYFLSLGSVENVEITTSPFWIKVIPRLEDHIEYEIVYP
ncbi:baseplate J/gp47 family protein [Patescibacteria group bacterium]|nr:baseplate J/gp47 family protein [Patescibacteria group bacterium]MBU1921862.1 baseplate J/gp47 family protein [Patescibacteria group bacterium]